MREAWEFFKKIMLILLVDLLKTDKSVARRKKQNCLFPWASGWDFLSHDAAGKYFSKQQVN